MHPKHQNYIPHFGYDYCTKKFLFKEKKTKMKKIHFDIFHWFFEGLRFGFELGVWLRIRLRVYSFRVIFRTELEFGLNFGQN